MMNNSRNLVLHKKKYIYIRIHKILYSHFSKESEQRDLHIGEYISLLLNKSLQEIDAVKYESNVELPLFTLKRDPTRKDAAKPIHISISEQDYQKVCVISENTGKKENAILLSILIDNFQHEQ